MLIQFKYVFNICFRLFYILFIIDLRYTVAVDNRCDLPLYLNCNYYTKKVIIILCQIVLNFK